MSGTFGCGAGWEFGALFGYCEEGLGAHHPSKGVPGVADLYSERITGAPYLEIKVNREAAAK
jgi:hypothetical protein